MAAAGLIGWSVDVTADAGAAGASVRAVGSGGWTVYHGDPTGSGIAAGVTAVTATAPAWTSPALDGQLYGEPLVTSADVYVATENDTVYALSPSTGAVQWSTHIASPVPASDLPCGDITPTVGITGTPVIDPSRSEIFVVADELTHGTPAHVLVGLNATSGAVELTQNVDPPGATPAALLQRTGLTLDAGQVVFGMGGNYGDCASYRGRVVAVNETGGTPTFFTVDAAAGDSQGAIWMGGAAPTVDSSGNIWVSVGNGSVHSTGRAYDDSDSALELSSSLALVGYFAPTSWPANNAGDLDMSTAVALLSDGLVVVAGKSRIIYLLSAAHPGGIGGQEASLPSACSQDIDGGTAVFGTTVFLPCYAGPVAVSVTASPPGLHLLWKATVGGGPPIVAAGLVWTIGANGTLYGLNPATGAVVQQASVGAPANHFSTPSVGDGLLLATSADHVVAFPALTAGATTTPTHASAPAAPAVTVPTAAPKGAPAGGGAGLGAGAMAGIVAGAVVLLGGASWLVLRARRRRTPAG